MKSSNTEVSVDLSAGYIGHLSSNVSAYVFSHMIGGRSLDPLLGVNCGAAPDFLIDVRSKIPPAPPLKLELKVPLSREMVSSNR